jgi:hypothetical protein
MYIHFNQSDKGIGTFMAVESGITGSIITGMVAGPVGAAVAGAVMIGSVTAGISRNIVKYRKGPQEENPEPDPAFDLF